MILNILKEMICNENLGRSQRYTGFTLAEVLITLAIIGIVAAMTIPTLMNKTNDAELKSAWKKEYSVFSQAVMQMSNDNGGSLASYFTDDKGMRDKFGQYLAPSKVCDKAQDDGCWASSLKLLNGNPNTLVSPAITLNDGSTVTFWLGKDDCTQAIGTPVAFYRCGGIAVDVNGIKKPNVYGKDIFEIHVLKDRILPYGTQGDPLQVAGNNCSKDGTGEACSAEFLYK